MLRDLVFRVVRVASGSQIDCFIVGSRPARRDRDGLVFLARSLALVNEYLHVRNWDGLASCVASCKLRIAGVAQST